MFHYDTRIIDRGDHVVVTKSPVDADSALALQYEAEVLARIRHPDVVELLAAPDHDDPSMITAYAGPHDLATHPPTDVTAARTAVRSVVATLGDLHRVGFAHGAVAPEHLVVGTDGRITLCGFRRAREVGAEESSGCSADGRAVATMIRWWLATIETRRADGPIAQQLAEVADRLEGDHPPTMRTIRTLLDQPRRPDRRNGVDGLVAGLVTAVAARADLLKQRAGRALPIRSPRTRTPPTASAPRSARPPIATSGRDADAAALRRREAWAALRPDLLVIGFHLAAVAVLALVAPFGHRGDPLVGMVTAGIWLLALVAGILGVLAGLVSLIADRRDLPRLRLLAGRASVPWVRRAAAGVAAFGASATSVVALAGTSAPSTVATTASPAPRPATPDPVPSTTTSTSTSTTSTSWSTTSTPTTSAVPVTTPTTVAALASVTEEVELPADWAPPTPDTWTVEPGDHLWSIATKTLSDRLGRAPSEAEIVPYWDLLIEANRDRLADPSNPDLILAGQELVLPSS